MSEIVGRERELALLRAFVESQERPAACVLQGEAGIGKTVLWEETVAQARARPERVLSCRPSQAETKLTFAGLGDLLADVAAETLAALPPPQRRALAVARRLSERGEREPTTYPVVPNAAEAFVRLGESDAAVEGVEWLERQGAVFDAPWALSQAARCRGLMTAAGGEQSAAAAHYERALVEHQRMASSFEKGRTLLAYGALLRRAKQKRPARERLAEALAIFEQLGASVWAERARSEAERVGGRRPADQELTATERQIAELVAQGRSNREVAATLVVSPRTVEGHLSRIYAKLGVRSRTQLAARIKVQ